MYENMITLQFFALKTKYALRKYYDIDETYVELSDTPKRLKSHGVLVSRKRL
jgi:hypothetical protein